MWFAALDNPQRLPWFWRFLERLLENEPTVTALLEKNPFPDEPPMYVRAQFYDYTFAGGEAGGPMVGSAVAGKIVSHGASESLGKPCELKRVPRSADILVVFRVH